MLTGLLGFVAARVGENVEFVSGARPVIGLAAAALAAVLASRASWHLTDWLMAWRQRADSEDL
jgi:hypothetical protein